jgi:acyl transferase domain-containing protein
VAADLQSAGKNRKLQTCGHIPGGGRFAIGRKKPQVANLRPRWLGETMSADKDIAVVGMACVWPGARNLRQYWSNLVNGVDAISEPPDGRWREHRNFDYAGHEAPLPGRRGGFLPGGLVYDPMPHRVLPNLVRYGDADQFLMLDVVDQALKDARVGEDDPVRRNTDVIIGRGGYPTGKLSEMALRVEMIDAFLTMVGWRIPHVLDRQRRQELEDLLRSGLTPAAVDNVSTAIPNLAANRTANRLNLRGSAYTVDGACASSLLAVETAVWRLRNRQSDLAVAAGLFLNLNATFLHVFASVGALSPSQVIRPFDRRADGLLAGEGGGAVVLKRLEDARRDGDAIYAVIKGVGSASDGKEVDVMAPAVAGQVKALEAAFADAGIDRDTIGFLEFHGTGTVAGDLTEITTIKHFFGTSPAPATGRAMGSVKSMIGHTMPAAGMASLIKMCLALSNRIMPPSLHCEEPRPELEDAPFYVLTQTRPWVHNPARGPRRGGINSFGFGGINAHVILEEVPDPVPARRTQVHVNGDTAFAKRRPFNPGLNWSSELLAFSASSRQELGEQLSSLENFIEKDQTGATLADLSRTLAGMADLDRPVKLALVCEDLPGLRQVLGRCQEKLARSEAFQGEEGVYFSENARNHEGQIACVIPGMGFPGLIGNYPDHLLELCLHFPEVRAQFDLFEDRDGHSEDTIPTSILFVPPPHLPQEVRRRLKARLAPPKNDEIRQKGAIPAERCLSGIGVALSNWASWALFQKLQVPVDMITGQSQGEMAALCAAGMGDFHEAIPGYWKSLNLDPNLATDAVLVFAFTTAEHLEPMLARHPGAHIAIYMAPRGVVLGGDREPLRCILEELHRENVLANPLPYGAIHTPHLSHLRESLIELYKDEDWKGQKRHTQVYSSITAAPFPEDGKEVIETMLMNIDRPLRIWQTVRKMYDDGARVFVQVGGGHMAAHLDGMLAPGARAVTAALDMATRHPLTQLNHLCATLFTAGVPIQLAPLHEHRSQRELDLAAPQPAPPPPALGIPLRIFWDPLASHRPSEASARSHQPEASARDSTPRSRFGLVDGGDLPVLGEIVDFVPEKKLALERRLSLDEDLFLHDHLFISSAPKPILECMPIVPLTMSMEFAAEAASLLAPGLTLLGFEQVRGRRWIHLREGKADTMRIEAALQQVDPQTGVRRFQVEHWFDDKLSFSVTALFGPSYRQDLDLQLADADGAGPWPFGIDEVYGERRMFHGPRFQGITALGRMGNPAATVQLTVLPKDRLFASRPAPRLLADPCLLDAMGQTFGLWADAHGHTILPIAVQKVELYGATPPAGTALLLRLEVTECDFETRQTRCNMEVVDAEGFVLVRMLGWADWLLNWPPQYFLSMRLFERHTLAQELALPGLPAEAVCALAGQQDFRNVELEWVVSLFLHSNESAALNPAEDRGRAQDIICGRAAAKDAIRLWWARRYGGDMPHPSEFCISQDAQGRPYLEPQGDPTLPHVTWAHSEGTYVALASEAPVGLDLEPVGRDTQSLLPDFATAQEVNLVGHLSAGQPDEAWATRLWCAKEAASKALGTGLQGRPKDFVALDADGDGSLVIEHLPTGQRFIVYTARLGEYILAYTRMAEQTTQPAPDGRGLRGGADPNLVAPVGGNGSPG